MKTTKVMLIACTGTLLLVSFQNCSKGFQGVDVQMQNLSSQCQAKIQNLKVAVPLDKAALDCENPQNYFCEALVYSPDVPDYVENKLECFSDAHSGELCVETQVRNFNTSIALNSAGPESFEPGGEFNNTEVGCAHSTQYKGVAVFVGRSDKFEEAFSKAKSICLQAKRGIL